MRLNGEQMDWKPWLESPRIFLVGKRPRNGVSERVSQTELGFANLQIQYD